MITSGRSIRKFLIKQQERYRAGPACPCTLHFLSLVQPVPSEGLSRAIPSAHIDCPRAASNRVVAFPALHSGSYTFEVVSLNAAGIHSPQPASLSFTINPPFWQTWWFIMLIVGVCLGLAALGYRSRVNQLLAIERLRLRISSDLLVHTNEADGVDALIRHREGYACSSISFSQR